MNDGAALGRNLRRSHRVLPLLCASVGIALTGNATMGAPPARYPTRSDIPTWWRENRALYCPLTNSGAGGSLMQYNADKRNNFHSFLDLPNMLTDARRLGCHVIFLVDYWDPDYVHKSDYVPKAAWGGPAALTQGVADLHAAGGRIILYLEAFIIHRDTGLGNGVGRDWAMMQLDPRKESCGATLPAPGCFGPFLSPYHDAPYFYWHPYLISHYEYYVMYPGQGSGWADYLVDLAGQLARDYHIDGVHLDSYGVHALLKDYHPFHSGGTSVSNFQSGARSLVTRLRAEMRKYVPDAIVMLEGASYQDLLDGCDGAQFENLAKIPTHIPYAASEPRRYPIYTSSPYREQMQAILNAGHNLALSPWWFGQGTAVDMIRTMLEATSEDPDVDGLANAQDNCPRMFNPTQSDVDADGLGDACDVCPNNMSGLPVDEDGCPEARPGDLDRDGDVDQSDFGQFQACFTGPGVQPSHPLCARARLDPDVDVDVEDFAIFQTCMSGANMPADPQCGEN